MKYIYLYIPLFIIIIPIILSNFVPKKEHTETPIEKLGKKFNIGLSIFYVPLSYLGLLSPLMKIGVPFQEFTVCEEQILNAVMWCGIFLPVITPVFMSASIILRRRGKGVISFVLQFVPFEVFIIEMVTIIIIKS